MEITTEKEKVLQVEKKIAIGTVLKINEVQFVFCPDCEFIRYTVDGLGTKRIDAVNLTADQLTLYSKVTDALAKLIKLEEKK